MSKDIVNPFVNIELHSVVPIQPYQMNNELYLHLKNNLKHQVENKCNNIGYICRVNEIVNYDIGYIEPEDFTGNVLFDVTFNAQICIPIKNTNIVAKIESIHKQLIIANNGPIKCIIKTNDINNEHFLVSPQNNKIIIRSNNVPLNMNDYVVINIRSQKSYVGEDKIGVMGYILNIASSEERKQFYYSDYIDDEDNIMIKTNDYINMNDDDFIDEKIDNKLKTNNVFNL